MSGPVTITDNEARLSGGAIWTRGEVTLPVTADISGNTAGFVSLAWCWASVLLHREQYCSRVGC